MDQQHEMHYEENMYQDPGPQTHDMGQPNMDSSSEEEEPIEREEDEESIRCWIYPRDPPLGQPVLLPRPILDQGRRVGRILSPALCHVDDVLHHASQTIQPHQPLEVVPWGAQRWGEVAQVIIQPPIPLRCSLPYDLRRGTWEPYMVPRVVPLLHRDVLTARVILPRNMHVSAAQRRIRDASDDLHELWNLITVGNQWLILSFDVPERIMERMRQLEEMQRVPRGGMPRHQDPRQQVAGFAQQRAQECVPQANPLTVAALLRSEHKSISSILNCRTPEQVKRASQRCTDALACHHRTASHSSQAMTHKIKQHRNSVRMQLRTLWR